MKIIYYVSFILLIITSCQSKEKSIEVVPQVSMIENPLNGTWVMTQYFDTIVANKSIAKYRTQMPTWFTIIIDIQQDTIITYGSMFDQCAGIDFTKDTLGIIQSVSSGNKWYLIQKETLLEMIQLPNQKYVDSTIYTFRRDDKMNNYGKRTQKDFNGKQHKTMIFESIWDSVTVYFNYNLFNGKYQNIETDEIVIFDGKGNISGLKDFKKYETNIYFGTSHPFKNRDIIHFDYGNDYNWIFDNDKLILTKFEWESEDSDYYELTDEVIVLEEIE